MFLMIVPAGRYSIVLRKAMDAYHSSGVDMGTLGGRLLAAAASSDDIVLVENASFEIRSSATLLSLSMWRYFADKMAL